MSVVPLTLTISLCLVFTFIVFFLREHARGRLSSAERDSLLPLAEEEPRLAYALTRHDSASHGHARLNDNHGGPVSPSHGEGECGCHDCSREPCPGCLRRK